MVEALRLVAAGGTYVPESVLALVPQSVDMGGALGQDPDRLGRVYRSCTPRQRQVVNLLCRGKSNKLIARELQISENTVKAHLRQIMKRLQATNRTEVALIASGLNADLAGQRPT